MFESKSNAGISSLHQGVEHEIKKNYVVAEQCYRVAADFGLAEAQFALGRLYDEGPKGIEQNTLEALKWYKRAAEQKHVEALFTLGYMYQFGQGVPKDEKKALAYYLEAAQLGHVEAQFHLGRLYQLSKSALQNNAEGIRWYALAAAQGHASARINLETMANTGIKGAAAALELLNRQALISQQPLKLSHLAQGLRYMTDPEQPDYRKAYEHLKIAVKKEGNKWAYIYFGLLHEYKKGPLKPSIEVALFFYAKADKNCVLVHLVEGTCYLRGMKQSPSVLNAKMAAESFNRAIDLFNEKGDEHLEIANFFEHNTEEKAQESADLILMMVYQMGLLGREKNMDKAVHFQQKIIEAGNVEIFYNLGELYAKEAWPCKDVREAARWYLFAANKKHAKASFALGLLYRDGLLDGEKNYQEALKWFLLAADEGNYALAHETVAAMYAKGLGGLKPNEAEADRRYALGKIQAKPAASTVQKISAEPPPTPTALTRILGFLSSKKTVIPTEGVQAVRVLHDWEAQLDHQLSITQGDTLYLLRELGDWLHCERRNHEDGMIPRNFVEFLPIVESPLDFSKDLPAIAVPILDKDIQYMRKLGEGGFGEVHKAHWNKMDVAVKRLLPCLDYDSEDNINVSAFKRELQIMLRLRHPNIVALCAYTTDTKTPYLVMEYMSGGSLWDKLGAREKKENFLPWLVRYSLAINIANGLQYLHKRKVLHRDLKSENVLLCYYAGNLFARLGDFGLSHMSVEKGSIQTLFSLESLGTPQWMAPELFVTLNGRVPLCYNIATDRYAFSVILWELMTHKKPYDGLGRNEIFTFVLDGKREDIPPDLQHEDFRTLIKCGWAQDPKERPPLPKFIELLKKGLQAEKIKDEKGKGKEDGMQAAIAGSSEIVKEEERIGPREIGGFELEDVKDDGNCFYRAVASQLRITGRRGFLSGIPKETALHDSLRLLVQGRDFNDKEWAGSEEIFKIVRQTRSIVAIIDTRHPHLGFHCYFSNVQGNDEDTHQFLEASIDLPIIRLAFTGDHYLSVMAHPALEVGAIRRAFRTGNISSSEGMLSSSASSTSLRASSSSDFFRIEPTFRNSGESSTKPALAQQNKI